MSDPEAEERIIKRLTSVFQAELAKAREELGDEFREDLPVLLSAKFASLGIDCSSPDKIVKVQRRMSFLLQFAENVDHIAWRLGWGVIWLAICGVGYLAFVGFRNPLDLKVP